jgi:hypothetical protein
MDTTIFNNLKNIHSNISNDVWPDGWHGKCHVCGKPFFYTKEECAHYLAHGWPKCDHKKVEVAVE